MEEGRTALQTAPVAAVVVASDAGSGASTVPEHLGRPGLCAAGDAARKEAKVLATSASSPASGAPPNQKWGGAAGAGVVGAGASVCASRVVAVSSARPGSTNGQHSTICTRDDGVLMAQPAAKAPRLALTSPDVPANDPRVKSRMDALLKEVGELARTTSAASSTLESDEGQADKSVRLERLISSNREQAAEIGSLTKVAAQREALIGQLQAQLMQARLSGQQAAQEAQQAAHAEQEQLVQQHAQMMATTQQHFTQQQTQLQQQLQQALVAAAHSQASQHVVVSRLSSFLSQTHQWLHTLSMRCVAQCVELPIEVTNALQLLSTATAAAGSVANGSAGHATAKGVPTMGSAAHPTTTAVPMHQIQISQMHMQQAGQVQTVGHPIGAQITMPPLPHGIATPVAAPGAASDVHTAPNLPAAATAPATAAAASEAARGTKSSGLEVLAAATSSTGSSGGGAQAVPSASQAQPPSATAPPSSVSMLAAGPPSAATGAGAPSVDISSVLSWGALPFASGETPPSSINLTLSPSAFQSLLSSPDILQLLSPTTPNATSPAAGAASQTLQHNQLAGYSQFKRRTGSNLAQTASNMAI